MHLCNTNKLNVADAKRHLKSHGKKGTHFGDGMGVRAALCIALGKFHRSFAVIDLYHCENCRTKLRKWGSVLNSFFDVCKGLIVEFPDTSKNIEIIKCEEHYDFFALLYIYSMSPLNVENDGCGNNAFLYMVQHVKKCKRLTLLPSLSGQLVNIIKIDGCSRYGQYKLYDVDENSRMVTFGNMESVKASFQLPEDRIYRFDHELNCSQSVMYQQTDLNQERKLSKYAKDHLILKQKVKYANAEAKESKLKSDKAAIERDMAYSKGCSEALSIIEQNKKLQEEAETSSRVSFPYMILNSSLY